MKLMIASDLHGSAYYTQALLRRLELPEHLTSNGLLEALNLLYSREDFLKFTETFEKIHYLPFYEGNSAVKISFPLKFDKVRQSEVLS